MPENPYQPPKEPIIADGPVKLSPLFWIVAATLALIVAAPALLTLAFILIAWIGCSPRN